MTIRNLLNKRSLSPLDAELILSFVFNKPREYLFTHPEHKLNKSQVARYRLRAAQRLRGEPLAYITGIKEFYNLEFLVSKSVPIPRPETELLVSLAVKNILNTKYQIPNTKIIDVGTGSGNVIVSIVKNIPAKRRKSINFYAIDISNKALEIAKKNVQRHGVKEFIKFIKSDLLECFLERRVFATKNLLIIANLPYIPPKLYQKYQKNLKYEPKKALISGKGGLDHYKRLILEIKEILKLRYALCIMCYLEISPEQKPALNQFIKKELSAAKVRFFKDLAGKWRVAEISLAP